MSAWPRRIDRTGQDKPGPTQTPSTVYVKRKKGPHRQLKVKRDDKKFEDGLIKAMGVEAAEAYMDRKRREQGDK